MAWRVGCTEAALEDLNGAAEYIARDSARYAGVFVRKAFDAADPLGDLANRGLIVPEFNDQTIRGRPDRRTRTLSSRNLRSSSTPPRAVECQIA